MSILFSSRTSTPYVLRDTLPRSVKNVPPSRPTQAYSGKQRREGQRQEKRKKTDMVNPSTKVYRYLVRSPVPARRLALWPTGRVSTGYHGTAHPDIICKSKVLVKSAQRVCGTLSISKASRMRFLTYAWLPVAGSA